MVDGVAIQYDLLTGVPVKDSNLNEEELAQVDEFVALQVEHDGLLLNAVIPELLQVSRQRWHQIRKEYEFVSWDFFGHTWYSRKQIEDFSKLDRSSGRGRPSLAKVVEATKKELLQ